MNNIRLDETVKKTLRTYEVPFNDDDWLQMESMLDVAPKHNPLGRSYSPVILFSLVIAGAAFLLYTVFKPSGTSENIHPNFTPPIVIKKNPEPKPPVTHSVVVDTVITPIKKEVTAPAKTVARHPVAVAPTVNPIKKELKTTEKKVTEKKTEKKTIAKKTTADKTDAPPLVSPTKNSKQTTLSNQDNKAKLFQKMLEKNKKTSKQEIKPAVKQVENDTVHIDDENDSNRSRQTIKATTSGMAIDSLKKSPEKKSSTKEGKKETKKSKKSKKASISDSLKAKNLPSVTVDPEASKKSTEQNQKDTLKAGN